MNKQCPFTGKFCDNPKLFKIQKITDDGYEECNLCHECSREFMQKHKDVMPINNPLSSLLASPIDKLLKIIKIIIKQGEINRELLGQYPCPDCGGTMVDFEETGRLGCAECYEFFREVLERISPQIQDNTLFSEQPVKTNHGESAIQSLELWMAECIQEEKYENAGTIKEMIKKLKEMK